MRFGWFCYKCFNFSNNGVCVIDEVIQVLVSTPDVRVQVPPRAPHFDLKSKDLGSFFAF